MRSLKVAGKEYPFILSAAAAKMFYANASDSDDIMGIDGSIKLIHKGLCDASMSKSWWERNITDRVPSEKKLYCLLELDEIMEVVKDVFPKADQKEEETEKKPLVPTT